MEIELASFGRAFAYLGIPFVLMIFYLQWHWARTCDRNIQILVAQESGGGVYKLARKQGGMVTIPYDDGTTRVWPINELATIEITYPGVGFVPGFLQKTIRQAIFNEGDWEPILNRSPHRTKIASPDVVVFLQKLSEDGHPMASEIDEFIKGVSTGPTREMIGDPAMLGNLMRSSVLGALATVSDELLDSIKGLRAQIARVAGINATYVYVGLGLVACLVGFAIYLQMQATAAIVPVPSATILAELQIIKDTLGIELPAPTEIMAELQSIKDALGVQ